MDIVMASRVMNMASLIMDRQSTVRDIAKLVGYSKSTVHKDLTTKLQNIDYTLYLEVKKLLDNNKKIRHIRGGESTKRKYQSKESKK